MVVLDETVLACPNCLFLAEKDANNFLRVDQGLNTFCRKGCPGREAHWLNTRGLSGYLISMENSRFLCYMTDCHGSLSGALWLHVPEGVELGRELAPLLLFSNLRFTRFGLIQPYQSTYPTE